MKKIVLFLALTASTPAFAFGHGGWGGGHFGGGGWHGGGIASGGFRGWGGGGFRPGGWGGNVGRPGWGGGWNRFGGLAVGGIVGGIIGRSWGGYGGCVNCQGYTPGPGYLYDVPQPPPVYYAPPPPPPVYYEPPPTYYAPPPPPSVYYPPPPPINPGAIAAEVVRQLVPLVEDFFRRLPPPPPAFAPPPPAYYPPEEIGPPPIRQAPPRPRIERAPPPPPVERAPAPQTKAPPPQKEGHIRTGRMTCDASDGAKITITASMDVRSHTLIDFHPVFTLPDGTIKDRFSQYTNIKLTNDSGHLYWEGKQGMATMKASFSQDTAIYREDRWSNGKKELITNTKCGPLDESR